MTRAEVITRIPKDYLYDTETEDVLVYRHKYTGKEIHIEKPVKRYRIEPCDDAISRQALINKAISWDKHFADSERYVSLTDIQNAPSVNPQEPKTGHWIDEAEREPWYRCSECNEKVFGSYKNYCSNCGAKMAENEEV